MAFPVFASSAAARVLPCNLLSPGVTDETKTLPSPYAGEASQCPYGERHTILPFTGLSAMEELLRIPSVQTATMTLPSAMSADAIVDTPPRSVDHNSRPVCAF